MKNPERDSAGHDQKIAEEALEEARQMPESESPRRERLLAHLDTVVRAGRDALADFDRRDADLAAAKAKVPSAVKAFDDANAAYAWGTFDPEEALRLWHSREVALAAHRRAEHDVAALSAKTRCPKVGLGYVAFEARRDCETIARQVAEHGFDGMEGVVHGMPVKPISVVNTARSQVDVTPERATLWILFERRLLREDKKKADELRAAFDYRWSVYAH